MMMGRVGLSRQMGGWVGGWVVYGWGGVPVRHERRMKATIPDAPRTVYRV